MPSAMPSRLKQLVHRGKDHHAEESSPNQPVSDSPPRLSSLPYDSAVAGSRPTEGGYPIRGKTSSQFERVDPQHHRQGKSRSRERRLSIPAALPSKPSSQPSSTIIPVRDTSTSYPAESNRNQSGPSSPPSSGAGNGDEHLAPSYSRKPVYPAAQSPVNQTSPGAYAKNNQHPSRRWSGNGDSTEQSPSMNYTQSRKPMHPTAQYPVGRSAYDGQANNYEAAPTRRRSSVTWEDAEQPPASQSPPSPHRVNPNGYSPIGKAIYGGQTYRQHTPPQRYREDSDIYNQPAASDASPRANHAGQSTEYSPADRRIHDGQAIVDRAKSNTVDTDKREHMMPPVTHEIVHHDIHQVREERITREIHQPEVYHRILPIIDVEVLPARHFLPVEGGGLVEVNAEDVASRKKNWVIAETVSQIPSGQPANTGRRQFSAREFRGKEGDTVTYRAPEGHIKTEQSWVHPPELETGARDTGQAWPLELGNLSLDDDGQRQKVLVPKSPKSKVSRKAVGDGQPAHQTRSTHVDGAHKSGHHRGGSAGKNYVR